MKGGVTVKLSGFKELDAALANLPKSAAKATLLRALAKAAQPIADAAKANAPVLTGELRDSIVVSTKLKNTIGKREFHEVMKAGGTRKEAGAAFHAARSTSQGKSFAVIFVGPTVATNKGDAIKRYAQEFGSVNHAPHPYLRPAWDSEAMPALGIIRRELANEIISAAKRIGKSKRPSYTQEIKNSAAIAALMAHEVG